MKRFIEGEDHIQVALLPKCLDDYIAEDNPARAVDAFVEGFDLHGLGFDGAVLAQVQTRTRCWRRDDRPIKG